MAKKPYALCDEDWQISLELWDVGWSTGRIAALMGVENLTIKRHIIRSGREWEPRRGGKNHWNYGNGDGGGHQKPAGYIMVYVSGEWPWVQEMAYHHGGSKYFILEHRKVMAEKLGRALRRDETVHHKNGVRDDNHPDNLQLRQGQHGAGILLQCNQCGSHDVSPVPLDDQE